MSIRKHPNTSVWTFQSKEHPRSSVQVGTDGKDWFVEIPVNPMVAMFEGIPIMYHKKGKTRPMLQWNGANGAKARCQDCLDAKVIAVADRLVAKCKREFDADPNGEHEPIEYASIWDSDTPAEPR